MSNIEVAKSLKKDLKVLVKVKDEVLKGTINIDINLGLGYFIKDDISKFKFLPVYNYAKQGFEDKAVMVKKNNIEWISSDSESDPTRDCLLGGDFNPIAVTVTLPGKVFIGEINLAYHKRLSERLNDSTLQFLPLLNVEYLGNKRTMFINIEKILYIYDEIKSEKDEFGFEESEIIPKKNDFTSISFH